MTLKENLLCSLALAGLVCAQPLAAATGPVCGVNLTSFQMEHSVNVTTIQSTLTPSFPPAVFAAVASGTQDVRSRISFNAATGILTNDLFFVPLGSPNPTPSSFNIVANRFAYLVVAVDNIYTSCVPLPSVMVTGKSLDGYAIYASPTGAPYSFNFGYNIPPPSTEPIALPPTTISNIVSLSSGLAVLFQGATIGTVNFSDVPATSNTPVILTSVSPFLNGPLSVPDNPYQIDASSSYEPGGGTLTYQWSSDKTATFFPSNTSPVPLITFAGGHGAYNITLTVTSEYGYTATAKFALVH